MARFELSLWIALVFACCEAASGQVSPAWVETLPLNQNPVEVLVTNGWANHESRIVVNGGGQVLVYLPDGAPDLAWQPPQPQPTTQGDVRVADLTGDGVVEVISRTSTTLYVRDSTGAYLPGWPIAVPFVYDLAAGDVDGLPGAEIVLMTTHVNLRVIDKHGVTMPGWPFHIPSPGGSNGDAWCGVSIADLDLDGTREIIASGVYFRGLDLPTPTYVLNPDGTLQAGWPYQVTQLNLCWPMVADLDGDQVCEIGGSGTNNLIVYSRHGAPFYWPFTLLPCPFSRWPAGAGDVTGDGIADFITTGGCVSVLDPTIPQHVASLTPPNLFFYNPLVGDVNGDGSMEIVVQVENNGVSPPDPRLFVLDGNLQQLPGFPVHLDQYSTFPPGTGGVTQREAIALGDLNGDGDLEIVQGFSGRLIVWDLPSQGNPSTGYPWTHWRGNPGATAFLYEGRYPPAYYRRGDANRDAVVDVADVSAMLRRLFLAEATKCLAQYDFNDSDTVDLADPLDLLQYLFAGGPMAAGAYPNCEVTQPLTEPLGCYEYVCP
ncbi:MAG: FG-GAP-like repeat-containing protein [Planctomycetota bacterium]